MIKYALGELPLPSPPAAYVPDRIQRSGVSPLAVEHSHALHVASLPFHHTGIAICEGAWGGLTGVPAAG